MSPYVAWFIGAMLAQGALALGLLLYLGSIRLPLIARGEVKLKAIALDRGGWPDREKQVSNAFDNQFQLPVLFYIAALLCVGMEAGLLEAIVAWLFVLSRYLHAFIHVTSNHVLRRFWAYTTGMGLLIVLWADLAIRLIISPPGI